MIRAKHYLSPKRPRRLGIIQLGLALPQLQGSRIGGTSVLLDKAIGNELIKRVEITGPTDRKMVINALNSGAKTFMADLEGEPSCFRCSRVRLMIDSTSPTWANCLNGQKNLHDAIRCVPSSLCLIQIADKPDEKSISTVMERITSLSKSQLFYSFGMSHHQQPAFGLY